MEGNLKDSNLTGLSQKTVISPNFVPLFNTK